MSSLRFNIVVSVQSKSSISEKAERLYRLGSAFVACSVGVMSNVKLFSFLRLGTSRSYHSGIAELPERLVHAVATLAGPAKMLEGLSQILASTAPKIRSFDDTIF